MSRSVWFVQWDGLQLPEQGAANLRKWTYFFNLVCLLLSLPEVPTSASLEHLVPLKEQLPN